MCDPAFGSIFSLTAILPYLKTHANKHPVNGQPLSPSSLIKLHFTKNEEGEYVDPVTYKVLTEFSKIVAVKKTGNVFSWDTVEKLNVKEKVWRDLVSDEEFEPKGRAGLVVLQDPDGELQGMGQKPVQSTSNGKAAEGDRESKILKAKEAVAKARAQNPNSTPSASASTDSSNTLARPSTNGSLSSPNPRAIALNTAKHTSGRAAASFTSTGLTPHTAADRAILSTEESLLKPRLVKAPGYARILTTHGSLNVALYPEHAPRAVWNFITLAKRGYYDGVPFHRNIKHFMIQGGDPTGTGRGGESCWGKGKPFKDELQGPGRHDARGVLSMANKGKDTNTSQFFVTYREAKHLDGKHTVFGRVVGGLETLDVLENVEVEEQTKRPKGDVGIKTVEIFVDPFEEYSKGKEKEEEASRLKEEIRKRGGAEDEKVTWTGRRVGPSLESAEGNGGGGAGGVGKYLKKRLAEADNEEEFEAGEGQLLRDEAVDEWEAIQEPAKKKVKAGNGFGNFDNW